MNIRISAIICTHNRAEFLGEAIQSLAEQTLSNEKYEIIVVDNCSTDSTKEVVNQFSEIENLRYIFESTLGLSYARNSGWRNARGKYTAYLDDDAIASPGWLEKILEVFETVIPRPTCVGGKTEPLWESSRPKWLSDELMTGLTVVDWSDTPHELRDLSQEWLVGANIAFPVEFLARVEGFSCGLSRKGKGLLSGDEIFLQKQILKSGQSCFYHPEIAVQHRIPMERLSKFYFIRRYYWQGISDATMQLYEEKLSPKERICKAMSKTMRLLQSSRKLWILVLPTDDPEKFTEKCFTLISVGHVVGLLTL